MSKFHGITEINQLFHDTPILKLAHIYILYCCFVGVFTLRHSMFGAEVTEGQFLVWGEGWKCLQDAG